VALQRLLTTVTLVGLLIATAAAFAITERLKLTKGPLMPGTKVSKVLSPTCGCARGHANVKLRLRRPDALTIRIVDRRKHTVRQLVADVETKRGFTVFRWDGRTDANTRAPDGIYQPEVHFARQHQTVLLPNRIQLDTTAPQILSAEPNRDAFSPDGDEQADFVRIAYELSKPAHIQLYLDGTRILNTYRHPAKGSVSWDGKAQGTTLPPGTYTLEVGARDLAGNSVPVAQRWRVHVRIRYIALASRRITGVQPGSRFEIGVSTDARRYTWQLGKRKGFATASVLRLRAPDRRGRYTLTVTERGHEERAAVIVR
jgi:flagellar hook assembly protein FlgD